MRKWKPVTEKYFGAELANGQGCDEPRDPAFKERFVDGQILNGRGSQGAVGGPAGSKPTPQRTRQAVGMTHNRGSYPKKSQQIRG